MITTVPIIYNGGSYGTYLEWCLTSLCSNQPIIDPFTSIGNSHAFKGNHLGNMQGWREYLSSNSKYRFARLHPKDSKTESITDNLIFKIKTIQILNKFLHKSFKIYNLKSKEFYIKWRLSNRHAHS